MKCHLIITLLFFSLPFLAQQKGASPINQEPTATYAVVVGISNYQDEGIPDLRFADKDAREKKLKNFTNNWVPLCSLSLCVEINK